MIKTETAVDGGRPIFNNHSGPFSKGGQYFREFTVTPNLSLTHANIRAGACEKVSSELEYAGYSSFLHLLQLASHNIAAI